MAEYNRRQFLHGVGGVVGTAAILPTFGPTEGVAAALNPPSGTSPDHRKIKGVMVDAARVPETLDYYRRVIAFCADWKLNTVHFRLTDDQGTALRFASVPDLMCHDHAFSPAQLKELTQFASTHGIDLIPEIESFGHTGFITRSATYKHLLDEAPSGSAEFTGIIPVHPQTLHLFEKLYREVADIFSSPYLHGGCDEVNWGGSALSQQELRSKSRTQIWVDYLNALGGIAEGLGKQFVVWGDFVLQKEPAILDELNNRIIIMDWNYWDTTAGKFHDALERVKAHGARAIGAPGLISYRWGARAGVSQLANIDAFADAYLKSDDPGSLGVILTNWVPSRYVQNSIWDGFAYAAVAFNDGSAVARKSAFQRFVERHYRAEWSDAWSQAFELLYDAAPHFGDRQQSGLDLHMAVPWSSDTELRAAFQRTAPTSNPFPHLRQLLHSATASVRSNQSDFRAVTLCVEYLDEVFWRESVIQEKMSNKDIAQAEADALIREIAERDRTLAAALSQDWDTGRFSEATAKTAPLYGMEPKDQLVFQFTRAAGYSTSLAQRPDHFFELLRSVGPA